MTTSTSSGRTSTATSTWAGIAVGVFLLGLMAAFAIGLPKVADDDAAGSASSVDLSLPDALPGGYAAADLAASFEDGELAEQAEAISEQQAESAAYGDEVLPEALGHPAVTRSYVVDGSKAVFVQLIAAEGGALSPSSLTDPGTTEGAGGLTMESVAGSPCILTYGQSQDPAAAAGEPVASQCQVSRDGLTVQLQSNQVPAADLVELGEAVLAGYDQ